MPAIAFAKETTPSNEPSLGRATYSHCSVFIPAAERRSAYDDALHQLAGDATASRSGVLRAGSASNPLPEVDSFAWGSCSKLCSQRRFVPFKSDP